MEKYDSAYNYLVLAINDYENYLSQNEKYNTKQIEEKYQNDKIMVMIENRNKLLLLFLLITTVIIISSIIIFRKNKQIKVQNETITHSNAELQKLLQQKKVLLAELQHRVKNNLQQVISILELQKESIAMNDIHELVRENQNRIHSMTLLHNKLNIVENINKINFDTYLQELSDLISNSYCNNSKKIQIYCNSKLGITNIETALPLGFITVELLSNSFKHAFTDTNEGEIHISIDWNESLQKNIFSYSDSGKGFDFLNTKGNGLGLEIIQGPIDQISGQISFPKSKGFHMEIIF